jgi:putative transposase
MPALAGEFFTRRLTMPYSAHVYHEIFLHLTWHTKNNFPLLIANFEPRVHAALRVRCGQNEDIVLHAINGTRDHVHLAISIAPTVCIADLVKTLKGGSSHDINEVERMKRLEWQRGYGVVSFGKNDLPWVETYIGNQKEHHAKGTMQDRLERTEFLEPSDFE